MQHKILFTSFFQGQILIYITWCVSGIGRVCRVCSCVYCKHVMLLGMLEKKDGGTHNFQDRHSCIFFIFFCHEGDHLFWVLFELVLSCPMQVPEGCLFPLMVDLLPFTEPLVWAACSLGAGSVQAPPDTSQGAAGHCHAVTPVQEVPGSHSSKQV